MEFNGIIFKIIYKTQNICKVLHLEIRNTNITHIQRERERERERGGGGGGVAIKL